MNNVKLSPADRKVFAERIGRLIPDPNSDEFDDLLEDLRSMKPDVYAELIEKLEYVGEVLPVEREAKLASRRSALQHVIDRVLNRQTHDGKTVSDRRKLIIGGLVGVGALFLWMTFSSFQSPYSPSEAKAQTPPEPEQSVQSKNAPSEHDFGVRAPRAQLAATLTVPSMPEIAAAPSADPLPRIAPEAETTVSATDSSDTQVSATDLPPRDPSDLPPRPTPVTSSASTVPTNPSALPTTTAQTASGSVPTTSDLLPTSLIFEQARQAEELPTTLSSPSTADTAAQTGGLEGVALSIVEEAPNQPERASSLSWEGESATAPDAATTLRWDEPDTRTQPATTLAVPQTSESLPAVPQVGTPSSDAQAPAARTQPQLVNLANALTTGSELEAELITAVAAMGEQGTPVLAKTTGEWCQKQQCPEITWIGEANYDGADRINIVFSEAVVAGYPQAVTAMAFDADRLPGIIANVGDGAPTAIQDLLRGAVGGAADYLNAVNTRTTTTVQDGVIVQEEAEPDLGNVLLGRSASLFALPTDQTSVIRYASLNEGKTITLIYGIDL